MEESSELVDLAMTLQHLATAAQTWAALSRLELVDELQKLSTTIIAEVKQGFEEAQAPPKHQPSARGRGRGRGGH